MSLCTPLLQAVVIGHVLLLVTFIYIVYRTVLYRFEDEKVSAFVGPSAHRAVNTVHLGYTETVC